MLTTQCRKAYSGVPLSFDPAEVEVFWAIVVSIGVTPGIPPVSAAFLGFLVHPPRTPQWGIFWFAVCL